MKNKILVVVYIPLLEKSYDIYIPIVKKVGVIKKLIIDIVVENSDGTFVDDGCRYLYYKLNGEKIDENQYVKDSAIKNGTKLILY